MYSITARGARLRSSRLIWKANWAHLLGRVTDRILENVTLFSFAAWCTYRRAPSLAMGKYIFILFQSLTIPYSLSLARSLWPAISNAKNVFHCSQRNRTLLIWVRSGRSNPFIPGQSKHELRRHEGTSEKGQESGKVWQQWHSSPER